MFLKHRFTSEIVPSRKKQRQINPEDNTKTPLSEQSHNKNLKRSKEARKKTGNKTKNTRK
jgi:hypothetical protein